MSDISQALEEALGLTCEERAMSVPESYFYSGAKSLLWQHIRQFDQPEGRRSAQEEGRKQMRDEVKGVEGTLLFIQRPKDSIISGHYRETQEYKAKFNERRQLIRHWQSSRLLPAWVTCQLPADLKISIDHICGDQLPLLWRAQTVKVDI